MSAATYGVEFVDELPAPLRSNAAPAAARPRQPRNTVTPPDHVAADSRRAHGTYVKYVVERCRCGPCRDANRAYERRRLHAIQRPDEVWAPYVPAGPVRDHVAELRRNGMGLPRIARIAGVSHGSLSRLVYGDVNRGGRRSRGLRPETARRILAVTAELENLGPRCSVPAAPTLALIEDLVARGYTKTWIATQIRGPGAVSLQLAKGTGGGVGAATARKVRDLHAVLEGQTGPGRRSRWGR